MNEQFDMIGMPAFVRRKEPKKEMPWIFKGEMVRAILDDLKTQSRRLDGLKAINESPDLWDFRHIGPHGNPLFVHKETGEGVWCPANYFVGQHRWVRENIFIDDAGDSGFAELPLAWHVNYKADGASEWCFSKTMLKNIGNKPSIHMPRWASRITLEVVSVRIERVQDTTARDAQREGVPTHVVEQTFKKCYRKKSERATKRIEYFNNLWDSINEARGYGWDVNPYVWVLEFKRVDV